MSFEERPPFPNFASLIQCELIRRTDALSQRQFTDGFRGKAWPRHNGAAGAIFLLEACCWFWRGKAVWVIIVFSC